MSKPYQIIERIEPELRVIFFRVRVNSERPAGTRNLFADRDRASREMVAWCEEQFGPRIANTQDFETGWWVSVDHEFSFSDDVAEWAFAFKMRWM